MPEGSKNHIVVWLLPVPYCLDYSLDLCRRRLREHKDTRSVYSYRSEAVLDIFPECCIRDYGRRLDFVLDKEI